ncbi:unnamed protein product [Rotaria magnacalcarata]|uniref:G-protein coupled receptors family 1 profile domain-containing protein n=1 Tax=Rotaria magnacalcarata TaxID=392030 RepID=A0A816XUD7_9BILA|nr:unnamed protein product [Rotaria magnacalcarata]CAF4048137.1 unnamed protein product [Rotaria magnacalcarata]
MTSRLRASLAFGQTIIVRYVESTLFAIGVTGSILGILLFSRQKLRSNSCCTYFLAASVAALILFLVGMIPQFYALNHKPDPIFNQGFCRGHSYVNQISAMLYRWFLTSACIDRCLLTSTNHYLRSFSTVRTARKWIILLSLIWCVLPIHLLIFLDVNVPGYITCIIRKKGPAIYITSFTLITGVLSPSLIMLVCSAIIWKRLRSRQQRRKMTNINTKQSKEETRDAHVIITLFLQVIIYIVVTLPYTCYHLYLAATVSVTNKSGDHIAIELLIRFIAELSAYIHPAIAFYVHIFASKTLRRELMILFCWIFSCARGSHFDGGKNIDLNTLSTIAPKSNGKPTATVD